jgi:hypothetical protein
VAVHDFVSDKQGLSDYMEKDTEGVHAHTSLWVSAFSGVSGTAMFWWWELLDQQNDYRHYRPLSAYLKGVSFAGLRPIDAAISNDQLRVLGYQGDDCAYLWISDSRATWWNQIAENKQPEPVKDATIEIRRLRDGTYRVEWWDTNEGKTIQTEQISSTNDRLHIPIPSFSRDVASKILR